MFGYSFLAFSTRQLTCPEYMGFAVPLAVQENSRGLFVSDSREKAKKFSSNIDNSMVNRVSIIKSPYAVYFSTFKAGYLSCLPQKALKCTLLVFQCILTQK